MKYKFLLSILTIPFLNFANANELSNPDPILICQTDSECYTDIYDKNYTFLKRLNIKFDENKLFTRMSSTYDYFDNTEESEGLFVICLKSDKKCKIFYNKETADRVFEGSSFPNRNKRNPLLIGAIAREIVKQTVRAVNTPQGKKVVKYMMAKSELIIAGNEISNGNDPWLGEPLNRYRNNRDSNIDKMSREIGGGGKVVSGRGKSHDNWAR